MEGAETPEGNRLVSLGFLILHPDMQAIMRDLDEKG